MPIYVFYDVCMALWFNYIDIKKVESKNGRNKKTAKTTLLYINDDVYQCCFCCYILVCRSFLYL